MLWRSRYILSFFFSWILTWSSFGQATELLAPGVRKVEDLVIYRDSMFYAAFPSVVHTDQNDYVLAFRRAPNRQIFGESGSNHTDPNSYPCHDEIT